MGFSEKVLIITGASSGIGAAIAVKFAEQRAKVVLVGRNVQRLKEIGQKCQEYGTKPLVIVADICKDTDIKNIIKTSIAEFDTIDILINNAGVLEAAAVFEENAIQIYDKIIRTNLRSAVYLTHLAVPHLIEARGNIINISSIAAIDTISNKYFAYCTSKAGLDHFSRCIAMDLAPKGVRVNTVNPGPVSTDIVSNLGVNKSDIGEYWKKIEDLTALGKVSEPEEIADLVLFLASDKARTITGSSYVADNGFLLKRDSVLTD